VGLGSISCRNLRRPRHSEDIFSFLKKKEEEEEEEEEEEKKKKKKKKKKKQTGVNDTQDGIDCGHQPTGQVEGEQWEGRGRMKGKKHRGAGEESQHHHNTKPEQY
jgi:microcompartment protein CcmL/EutN